MAATPYIVAPASGKSGQTLIDHVNAVIVSANSSDEAKGMAQAMFPGDSDSKWSGATVTDLSSAPNDWEGWTVRAKATDNLTPFTVIDVSHTAEAEDSFDDMMDGLVTALNATAINGAAWATDTLKVAETSDGRGDWLVEFYLTAPNGASMEDLYVSAITDEGSAGAALTVALVASGTLSRSVTPTVVAGYA